MGNVQMSGATLAQRVYMRRRWIHIVIVLLVAGIWMVPTHRVEARPTCATQPELCVGLVFRDYWQQQNGLANFGLPIGTSITRYLPGKEIFYTHNFEYSILEHFPTRKGVTRYQNTPVGQLWYERFGSELTPLGADEELMFQPGYGRCTVVESSRPSICGEFLDYYMKHGIQLDGQPHITRAERLGLLGYPITPVMKWSHAGQTQLVQVFSHARLDYVPNNAADNKIIRGKIVGDLLNANVALPTTPSTPINHLVESHVPLFDTTILDTWRKVMPSAGYWQAANQDIYLAVSSFTYHEYFYTVRAGHNLKYVAFTMLVKNQRMAWEPSVYLDHSYIGLIDTDGNYYSPSAMHKYLATPLTPSMVVPGASVVGQVIFVVPHTAAPAQIEVNLANLDAGVSRFSQNIELRVAPIN
jgi:hypothetical protein